MKNDTLNPVSGKWTGLFSAFLLYMCTQCALYKQCVYIWMDLMPRLKSEMMFGWRPGSLMQVKVWDKSSCKWWERFLKMGSLCLLSAGEHFAVRITWRCSWRSTHEINHLAAPFVIKNSLRISEKLKVQPHFLYCACAKIFTWWYNVKH